MTESRAFIQGSLALLLDGMEPQRSHDTGDVTGYWTTPGEYESAQEKLSWSYKSDPKERDDDLPPGAWEKIGPLIEGLIPEIVNECIDSPARRAQVALYKALKDVRAPGYWMIEVQGHCYVCETASGPLVERPRAYGGGTYLLCAECVAKSPVGREGKKQHYDLQDSKDADRAMVTRVVGKALDAFRRDSGLPSEELFQTTFSEIVCELKRQIEAIYSGEEEQRIDE